MKKDQKRQTLEKLQRARGKQNKDKMKRIDFINKKLRGKNEGKAYINIIEEARLEYYRVFAKNIKPLPPESSYQIFTVYRKI